MSLGNRIIGFGFSAALLACSIPLLVNAITADWSVQENGPAAQGCGLAFGLTSLCMAIALGSTALGRIHLAVVAYGGMSVSLLFGLYEILVLSGHPLF